MEAAGAQTTAELAAHAVDAIDAVSGGPHEGRRAAHAKGTLCAGAFVASERARELTRAAHMQGEPVRATVRFSNGSGDPEGSDAARLDARGIAVKLYLPDGTTTDIVGLTLPLFPVRTPEDFVAFTRARAPASPGGEPDPEALSAFLADHPETQAALGSIAAALGPPVSYATCAYNSIHSYRMTSADGESRFVRYRFEPEAGEARLPEEEIDAADRDYLQAEVRERLAAGEAAFRLWAVVATDDDPVDDPTVAWPDERERVELGRLALAGPEEERERGDDILVFDPSRVTDGIECSDDPILGFRPHAYAESVFRRTGVRRGE